MSHPTPARTTRRRLVGGAVLLGTAATAGLDASLAAGNDHDADLLLAARFQDGALVGEATMPAWTFLVVTYQDPYAQPLVSPQQPEAGKRYIGAEVEIRNESDRPLSISGSQIRLRDADALEYTSGGAVGSDPRLFDVNMLPGERARGWIWFAVPEAIHPAELFYVPPAPQLRVPIEQS